MLKQISTHEYDVTHLVLNEDESERLEQLLSRRDATAVRYVDEAVERASSRVSVRPLRELLRHS
jgi:hypothetical protein